METEGIIGTPKFIAGQSEVWVTWVAHLQLVSEVRVLNLGSLMLTPGS